MNNNNTSKTMNLPIKYVYPGLWSSKECNYGNFSTRRPTEVLVRIYEENPYKFSFIIQ